MDNIDRIRRNIRTRRQEDYEREVERTLWVGIVLVALFSGFLGGMLFAKGIKNENEDVYYMEAEQYGQSNGTLISTDGSIWFVDMETDYFAQYRLKLKDNGTETKEDDIILEVVEIW